MATREVQAEDMMLKFGITQGTEGVVPLALFPKQPRLQRAFDLALNAIL